MIKKRPAKPASPQNYAIPALQKGLDVLELLSQARRSLGLNDIATALGRSRQELFRVVTCLSQRGYLLRDSTGDYRLSSKMLEVGSRHVAQQVLVTQAMPAMEILAETTGESCQLSLVNRERLLVVANAIGTAHLQLDVRVGNSIPMYHSVVGLVAIAFMSELSEQASWERRREIQKSNEDVIDPDLKDFAEWQARLAMIRHEGFLTALSPAHAGSRVHAGPLLNASGKLSAVLSIARLVPYREDSRRSGQINRALLDCCQSISSRLGAVDDANFLDQEPAASKRNGPAKATNGRRR